MRKGAMALAGLLGLAALGAAPITDLTTIKDRAGETLTISGEVKGVSLSPRSRATYLNFGDAYPRQAISARVARDHEAILDALPSLFGRTIEVDGTIQATPTGPIIEVSDPKQIRVVPPKPDEPGLDAAREGEAYLIQFGTTIRSLLQDKNFAKLEALAAKWRKEKTRNLDGRWKLECFYDSLTPGTFRSEQEFQDRFRLLDKWKEFDPKSVTPVIAKAKVLTQYAWKARGSGYANTVTEKSWRLFGDRLDQARRELGAVEDRRFECPEWSAAMQPVALGEGWDDENYLPLFDGAVAHEPEYWSYYLARATRLLPRWGGESGDWEKFARSLKGEFGEEMLARIAWNQDRLHDNIFRESTMTWPEVKAGFERIMKTTPESRRNLSAFALFAGMAGDRPTCRELLDRLGDHADMQIWVSWENVALVRRWCDDEAAPKPIILHLD